MARRAGDDGTNTLTAGRQPPSLAAVLLLACAAAAGCVSGAPPGLPTPPPAMAAPALARAIITTEDVQRSIDDERVFIERADRLPQPGEPWFAVLGGCSEVLV